MLQAYRQLAHEGALSRIGAVFAPGSGGPPSLAAMAVPPERLEAVAATVSAHPGVNRNHERETPQPVVRGHRPQRADQVECTIASLEQTPAHGPAAPAHAAPLPDRHWRLTSRPS